MIQYENGRFGLLSLLQMTGSVVPAAFLVALPASSTVLVFRLLLPFFTTAYKDYTYSSASSNVWSGFSLILGFLIVFRSQQAYSRWWEGGTLLKQMRGDWFNAYSSLLAFTNPAPEKQEEVALFQHQIVRLFSLLHGAALEFVTDMRRVPLDTIELHGFDAEKLIALRSAHNKVEVILQWIQKLIVQSDSAGVIKVAPPILSRVYNELGNGIVYCNNAKKIGEFKFPFPMAQLMAIILGFHMASTMYISIVFIPGHMSSFCASFAVLFAFWSINLVSIEIEMPFGDDCNDLPLLEMQTDFNCSLSTLLEPAFLTPPKYSPDSKYQQLIVTTASLDGHMAEASRGKGMTGVESVRVFGADVASSVGLAQKPALKPSFTFHPERIYGRSKSRFVTVGANATQSKPIGRSSCESLKGSTFPDKSSILTERVSVPTLVIRETIVEESEDVVPKNRTIIETPDSRVRTFPTNTRNTQGTFSCREDASRETSPREEAANTLPYAEKERFTV